MEHIFKNVGTVCVKHNILNKTDVTEKIHSVTIKFNKALNIGINIFSDIYSYLCIVCQFDVMLGCLIVLFVRFYNYRDSKILNNLLS